ncbi:DUF7554 family protein [Natrarchaeobaculum aegyptiacum]|uniref:Uncharacterized protein n=1 Tax=Natrarchaeobaculum aegyptiacum TaxID=745377 RepID=A0A2Z2HRE5_9EURY|nr:hypothetical protein [Natrarchaeobaculum aegyptiacum]ARS89736.1 hypothetical protein B1756_08275 [Natrarchaeobaculum aegyptiacum]
MIDPRAALSVETLLKIVLGLIAVLLALRIVETIFGWVFSLLVPGLLLVVALLIVLWFLDRL